MTQKFLFKRRARSWLSENYNMSSLLIDLSDIQRFDVLQKF